MRLVKLHAPPNITGPMSEVYVDPWTKAGRCPHVGGMEGQAASLVPVGCVEFSSYE